ncbi:MAG: ABC transporter ATP-binding protein [Candidatus Omnitrophica bacterium]|nr:ABC transporter ATP-binding protein [Candidatus Omnitrophota bacterium]
MSNPIIQIQNVNFAYLREPILEDVNLDIQEKDFMGIIGPNGAGKSTLIKLILGFLKPQKGIVRVYGEPPGAVKNTVGYVPQHIQKDLDFPITVEEVIAMGVIQDHGFFPWLSSATKLKVQEVAEQLSISELIPLRFGDLSYGQKQRCLIARAIVAKPSILILDEPTASVDSKVEKDIYELLKQLNQDLTILLISHDLGFVSAYVNKVACVNRAVSCHLTKDVSHDVIDACYHSHMKMVKHQCEL